MPTFPRHWSKSKYSVSFLKENPRQTNPLPNYPSQSLLPTHTANICPPISPYWTYNHAPITNQYPVSTLISLKKKTNSPTSATPSTSSAPLSRIGHPPEKPGIEIISGLAGWLAHAHLSCGWVDAYMLVFFFFKKCGKIFSFFFLFDPGVMNIWRRLRMLCLFRLWVEYGVYRFGKWRGLTMQKSMLAV